MSDLPQLMALAPQIVEAKEEEEVVTIIPASEEKVYDKFWLTQLSILAQDPTKEARIVAVLVPARDVTVNVGGEDVVIKELMPDAENTTIVVPNLFERMASTPSLAIAMGAVLNELTAIGQEKGILAS